jgi:hypothetical protein
LTHGAAVVTFFCWKEILYIAGLFVIVSFIVFVVPKDGTPDCMALL